MAPLAIALAILTIAVYAQTGAFDFQPIDDQEYVADNPAVQHGITGESLTWAFTHWHSGNWHPLTWISHMVDWQMFGPHAGGHHLVNVAFHALASVLLLIAFVRMTGALWPSAFVAAIFALHPGHVESVAWIAERKDVLSGLFFMLTLLAYAAHVRRPGAGRYALVAVALALGLLSKPMLVTLPFVLLLLDVWPFGRWAFAGAESTARRQPLRRLLIEKAPLLGLALISAIVTYNVQRVAGSVATAEQTPIAPRLVNAVVVYVLYVWKTVLPVGLSPFYPWRMRPLWEPAAAAVPLVVVTWLAWRWRARRPWFGVGWAWFLGMLVPVIGIVQVGRQALADRYLYLPQIGLTIMIAWGVAEWARTPAARRVAAVAGMVAVAACTVLTFRQVGYWKNGETLFAHALAVSPDNYLAHTVVGSAEHRRGELEEALEHYREAVKLNPTYAWSQGNLGLVLAQMGRLDEAEPHLLDAIRLDPKFADAHRSLGILHAERGDFAAAKREIREAIRLKPRDPISYFYLGKVLEQRGDTSAAREAFGTALRLRPGYTEAVQALKQMEGRP